MDLLGWSLYHLAVAGGYAVSTQSTTDSVPTRYRDVVLTSSKPTLLPCRVQRSTRTSCHGSREHRTATIVPVADKRVTANSKRT